MLGEELQGLGGQHVDGAHRHILSLSSHRLSITRRNRPVMYSPAPCWDFTNLVARSMQTIRHPVTFGSSVPLWPVLSTRRIRLSQATTSCEDGLEGLSKLITPDLAIHEFQNSKEGKGMKST